MKRNSQIFQKLSILFYLFTLYQLWSLCQYGGLRRHMILLFLGCSGAVVFMLIYLILAAKTCENGIEPVRKGGGIRLDVLFAVLAALGFGAGIIYSAIPYHGALSWKIEEWTHKKEIALKHGNVFESGAEGILTDLDEALELPEKLYIADGFEMAFDGTGTIQSISAFLYGTDEKGSTGTYLIDYDADQDSAMTVWLDGETGREYNEDKRLEPMLQIFQQTDWKEQVKSWSEQFGEETVYEILYYGKRSFPSREGLRLIFSGVSESDKTGTGALEAGEQSQEEGKIRERQFLTQLDRGGELLGFEVSLHIPEISSVTPIRYMLDPDYISQETLSRENEKQQAETAKEAESWTVDRNDGSMYFFLDVQNGWRLSVADAAAGSRFYVLEQTTDGGNSWECTNQDPFSGNTGVAEGLIFFDENTGVAGLSGAAQYYSSLYLTRDRGGTFEQIELPLETAEKLPESAEKYGQTIEDYAYMNMPKKEADTWTILVTAGAGEREGLVFQSTDNGKSWIYEGTAE